MNVKKQKIELDRCLNGCTINGKKLTGRHYFYLNYCKIDGKLPEYRAKDDYFFRHAGQTKGMILRK